MESSRVAPEGRCASRRSRAEPRLSLSIVDDGVGLPREFAEGVGLRNTRTRLRELYGDDHAFVVFAPPAGGTEARIEIPLHRATA